MKTPQKQNVSTVRLIFDSGSQNTYVTSDLKNALSLPVIGKEKMFIKTFGDVSPKFTTYEIVQLGIAYKCKQVQVYVVPVICTPISNQLLSIEKYEHLRGLDLADYCDGDELEADKKVEILVGADNYWHFVGVNVIRGKGRSPVAMETKVGWVVSGPTQMVSENSSSHLLKLDGD